MGKLKRMDQIRFLLKTYLETSSYKGTARRLRISKNTVRTYIRRIQSRTPNLEEALQLEDAALVRIAYGGDQGDDGHREITFFQNVDYWLEELKRVGVTRKLLWEEYRTIYSDGYGYSQFCERLSREIGRRDLTLKMHHKPGEVLQVDFAGKTMDWVDPYSGEVHSSPVLIACMPFSQYSFAIVLPSQKVADFIHGLNQALLYLGCLPKVIMSDNLKSFVTKANKYEPDFNELCVQLASWYQLDLEATRVGKPKDKASVENLVSTVYTRIFAPLRNEVFHSIEQINEAVNRQLTIHNQMPYQQRSGCRLSEFETHEKPQMKALPSELFEVKRSTKAKVRRDYHVYMGEEKNYYSVPFQYVGKQSVMVYTQKVVEIYIDHKRVAIHSRLLYRNLYRYQTNPDHMPKSHLEWRKSRGFNAAYFINQAKAIGPATTWAVGYIIRSYIHEPQSYNSCQGVLRLGQKYSNDRLEKAAIRCQKAGKATYKMIKNILDKNLDQLYEPPDMFTPPRHENIRGPQAYQ